VAVAAQVGNRVRAVLLSIVVALLILSAAPARAGVYYLTVAGLGGEPNYEQRFTGLATELDRVFKSAGANVHVITLTGKEATRERLNATIAKIAGEAKPGDDFVLVLIGHGSFDGVEYKFNLVGPDISGGELATLCDRVPSKRQLIVNTTSSSGGSFAALKKAGRAVIAATKSGTERNATVFARYWVEALEDPTADQDKNETISALETFQYAAQKTASFYESQKRLATEHAMFEDTGKGPPVREVSSETGEGRLVSNFTLLRLGGNLKAANDPAKRDLLAKREQLEQEIDELKYRKAAMPPGEYKTKLTAVLVELATIQKELDK